MCPPSAAKPVASYCDSGAGAPSSDAALTLPADAHAGKLSSGESREKETGEAAFLCAGVSAKPSLPPSMLSGLSPEMASSLRTSRASSSTDQDTEMCVEVERDVSTEPERTGVSCETLVTSTPVVTTGGEEGESEGESDDFSTCVAEDRDFTRVDDGTSAQESADSRGADSACVKSEWAFFEAHSSWRVSVVQDANDLENASNEDTEAASQCRLPAVSRPKDKTGENDFDDEETSRDLSILQENESTCCQEATDDANEETPRGCALCRGESDCIGDSCCGFVRSRDEREEGPTESSLDVTNLSRLQTEENEDAPSSVPETPRGCPVCRVDVDFGGGLEENSCCWQARDAEAVELHAADKQMGKLFTSLEYLRHQEQSCGSLESDTYESEDEESSYPSPRCFPSLPEESFSRQETVFIFDWDDTLLPSSWISQKGLTLESAESEVCLWRMKLAQTAMWAEQTLFTARSLGQVIIVTNAESGWIDLSCSKFLPELREMLNCFPIVSARSMYESAWCNTPFMWKEAAFMHELQRHFRMESKRWNVISVGDSTHEREALLTVCSRLRKMYHVTTKSLKLLESPAVEELHSQHELMSKCLAAVARHKGNLDLCITNAAEPEIDPAAVKLPPALQGRAVGVHRIRHHPLSQELLGRA
ncbi:hypothetical protein TGME49_271960 [Toxoplasma gondii ME49]|uniref:Uncharacterized protein n=10 Tax=Toxoplasma gondii TaxID=5811 RepID=S7V3P6_TOXGG|nr:hypothetical protein TGME49_271960 [Toxoplasma gondii ME49]EPR64645.1 hypothetical protein TGGT1_271960 [Toxoplasma gondii GT1]KAF4642152.1 hypothetical protein TGRH88_079650 [Toxoplasma gondii]KFG43348.1 hypothetical protein TGDOM2_271960 [Toxoplasma gondii GAB2-2007-GAL-DOM2]KFG50426.1 hypothetical protein TGFOU_271960 [Toxoplasma gondii FOU]KFG51889.1 hypothetical protein TGP89_271960 [Toxoplasma gondii p89]KFG64168.1 hypothetical protein TGRUB_271960 [Toxoplasma gondii RUB]KYF47049.1 |eukprot:XP_002365840.1 hypothetical protein TGME49_271960 [Toxoplasma gondii ME49]